MTALSKRELETLVLTSGGMGTKEAARALGLSVPTIKDYRRGVIVKLDARNMPHAIALALRGGLIT